MSATPFASRMISPCWRSRLASPWSILRASVPASSSGASMVERLVVLAPASTAEERGRGCRPPADVLRRGTATRCGSWSCRPRRTRRRRDPASVACSRAASPDTTRPMTRPVAGHRGLEPAAAAIVPGDARTRACGEGRAWETMASSPRADGSTPPAGRSTAPRRATQPRPYEAPGACRCQGGPVADRSRLRVDATRVSPSGASPRSRLRAGSARSRAIRSSPDGRRCSSTIASSRST